MPTAREGVQQRTGSVVECQNVAARFRVNGFAVRGHRDAIAAVRRCDDHPHRTIQGIDVDYSLVRGRDDMAIGQVAPHSQVTPESAGKTCYRGMGTAVVEMLVDTPERLRAVNLPASGRHSVLRIAGSERVWRGT